MTRPGLYLAAVIHAVSRNGDLYLVEKNPMEHLGKEVLMRYQTDLNDTGPGGGSVMGRVVEIINEAHTGRWIVRCVGL